MILENALARSLATVVKLARLYGTSAVAPKKQKTKTRSSQKPSGPSSNRTTNIFVDKLL